MGRPSKYDGSFVIRLSKQEVAELGDPTSYLEIIIRECGVDPDLCECVARDSADSSHVLFTVTPKVKE